MRILIADDNLDLAESIATVLRPRGAVPTVVGDGAMALRAASRLEFDAALIDLKLPRRSGLDVLKELRRAGTPELLIAMTGYDSADRIAELGGLGIETVLRKPFDLRSLLDTLGLAAGAGSTLPSRCRVAFLVKDGTPIPHRPLNCVVDRFRAPDVMREAVAEHPYDAAVILADVPGKLDLVEDLKSLDGDLAVLLSSEPELLAAGVERTRERREGTRELAILSDTFERAPGALMIAAGDPLKIHRWNRELLALLGNRPSDLDGTDLAELEGDPAELALTALAAEADGTEAPVERRLPVRLRGGSVRLFDVRAVRVQSTDHAVCLSFAEFDPRGGHAEALQLLGATAAGVAHEMRNTLAGVGASLAVLRNRLDPETAEGQVLQRVLDRIGRAGTVMDDLLEYARPTTPRLKAVPARMIVSAAADQIREQAPSGIRVEVEVADPSLRILVDPVAIQMALVNLGINAVQAMPGSGRLGIRCGLHGDRVEIRVDDDGPGIRAEIRQKVFAPFFTTRARGSGLGLANVKKVIEAHGGSLELLERSPGAHFLIRLPPRPEIPAEKT